MMDFIVGIAHESYQLFLRMAPFLLFGFFFAGLLHIFISTETIARHLGRGSLSSVIKASLFGIPLPLCSCGVIPAALALRKEGASRGAVLSFLISTPTTGIDSIFVNFVLLGGFFTAYRIGATFLAALFVGVVANIFIPEKAREPEKKGARCTVCKGDHHFSRHTIFEKVRGVFQYAFFGKMYRESFQWMVFGILIGGAISYLIPPDFFEKYLGSGVGAILVMFIIGAPMYICSSGSIPIAASLMLKGLNPGAAFAFLLAGPATNTVTMAMVFQTMGKRALAIYLAGIFCASVFLGILFDFLWTMVEHVAPEACTAHAMALPINLELWSAIILFLLFCVNYIRVKSKKE
jgi:uncharacterized membrane protein YraQ (UPF0718 family)